MIDEWPELISHSETNDDRFANVNVTTLYSHCEEIAAEKAYNIYIEEKEQDPDITPSRYYQLIEQQMPYVAEREFVKLYDDHIEVCVDFDKVDDNAIRYALSLLLQVDNFTVAKSIKFGHNKCFQYRG